MSTSRGNTRHPKPALRGLATDPTDYHVIEVNVFRLTADEADLPVSLRIIDHVKDQGVIPVASYGAALNNHPEMVGGSPAPNFRLLSKELVPTVLE